MSISRIAGVRLEPEAVVSCSAASALESWVVTVAKPEFRRAERPLRELHVVASYVCRNVNDAEDGDLSEHASGNAVDIAGFGARRGDIAVGPDWTDRKKGAVLKRVLSGACGIFGTTLGPDSDRYHHDHFHFDVAERRRPYCP